MAFHLVSSALKHCCYPYAVLYCISQCRTNTRKWEVWWAVIGHAYEPTFISFPVVTTTEPVRNIADKDKPFLCYWPGCDFAVESAVSLTSTAFRVYCLRRSYCLFSFHHIHHSDHVMTHKVENASTTIVCGDTASQSGSSSVETGHGTAGIRMDVCVVLCFVKVNTYCELVVLAIGVHFTGTPAGDTTSTAAHDSFATGRDARVMCPEAGPNNVAVGSATYSQGNCCLSR